MREQDLLGKTLCSVKAVKDLTDTFYTKLLTTTTMIQNISGCAGVLPIECVSPRKNKWKIRWDITEKEDGTAEWYEEDFDHKPTSDEIRSIIVKFYNNQVDEKILSGFRWKDMPVWLSTENQLNYKVAFDLAVQTNGASLPVTFKFGTDGTPVYYEFTNLAELQDFYTKAIMFVQNTLAEGWKTKDNIDYNYIL